jgi:hypothetical protein
MWILWIWIRFRTAFSQAYQTRDKTASGRREASARRARKLGQYSQKLHMLKNGHLSKQIHVIKSLKMI